MVSKKESMHKDLKDLIIMGNRLYYTMADDLNLLSDDLKKELKKENIELANFKTEYDTWYSEALVIIKQLLPDRLADFIRQYKDEKRKEIVNSTYGIADYLHGVKITNYGKVIADSSSAFVKMQNQNSILQAVEKRFKSSLFDIQEVLQADIFDTELDAATELVKKGFVRGGGAISGVVLEKHLGHVCKIHNLTTSKKHPTIADYYQLLKDSDIIDIPMWRFIQHLGDLRNLCDHNKDKEPTKDEVLDLITGVEKVIKNVW